MTTTWTMEDKLPQDIKSDDFETMAHMGQFQMKRCSDGVVVDYPVGTVVLFIGPRGPCVGWEHFQFVYDWFDVDYYVRVE